MTSSFKTANAEKVIAKQKKAHARASAKYYQKNKAAEREKSRIRQSNIRHRKKIEEMEKELLGLREEHKRACLRRKAFEKQERFLLGRIDEVEKNLLAYAGPSHTPGEADSEGYDSTTATMDVFYMTLRDNKERERELNLLKDGRKLDAILRKELSSDEDAGLSPLPPSSPLPLSREPSLPIATP